MNRHPALLPTCLCLASLLSGATTQAAELVYTPVNPAFGGNPLNGTWLLNEAQAQNSYEDDAFSGYSYTPPSALEQFSNQLQSQLLSQFLSNVNSGKSGSLTTNDFIIDLQNDSGNLTMRVVDRHTGEVSEILVNGLGN